MKLVLLGAPGAGKGTQAVKIAEKYGIVHISTGDIFRKNLKEGTPVGLKAKAYIDKGQLVPDEVTCEIVAERLKEADCQKGFMLDGFPRNVYQAQALEKMTDIDVVLNIAVDLNKLMARLTGRRVCAACGESYHVSTFTQSKCLKCGGDVIQRADDTEETVGKRLQVYTEQTQPLIDFYQKKGKLQSVDGMAAIDDVFADVVKVLDAVR
ncbi:MAG: adenylate kinase [Clostridia bacterium]|jgi:adenylate kinase|nr:adenylate kinase [Clostridia bacterium]